MPTAPPPSTTDNRRRAQEFLSCDFGYPDPLPGQVESLAALFDLWQSGSDGAELTKPSTNGDGKHRRRMPKERQSLTHKVHLGDEKFYITVGMYDDGKLGELFITGAGKEGSTISGLLDAFSVLFSMAIQYGVPLRSIVNKLSYMSFDPSGPTDNPDVRVAKSIPDYVVRWLAAKFLDDDACEELGVMTEAIRARKTAALNGSV